MKWELTPARKAMLATINWAEGSPSYDELFNYAPFPNFPSAHPNIKITAGGYSSEAAGAYQFLYDSWQDTIKNIPIPDYMSPENQDQAAIERINFRNALQDIDNLNIDVAIEKLSVEWASFPPSQYNQPVRELEDVKDKFYEFYEEYAKPINAEIQTINGVLLPEIIIRAKRTHYKTLAAAVIVLICIIVIFTT